MTVKNRLVNSNGTPRSTEHISVVGQRHSLSNNGASGYIYALDMARQNWWDLSAEIDGSWSPDSH